VGRLPKRTASSRRIGFASTPEGGRQRRQWFAVATLGDPLRAQRQQAGRQVDARIGSEYGPDVS
jgi:hypothetical protein